ncbi:MAG: hypothetical protein HGB11_02860 [Chlorobiales bacterium]|jgi:hypothetical protein|nr:hypothetical protein [Chlorobiales bacterium]
MAKNPVKMALWGMLVGNIEDMGILPALQAGKAIAKSIDTEGGDVLEKLSRIDGDDNYEIVNGNGDYKFVILKHCPFGSVYSEIPEWGDHATKLVAAYNRKADGGGALHPLCLVHKGVRNAMNAGIVSLGCRSEKSGKIEVAEDAVDKISADKEDVIKMLDGKACIFAIRA